MQAEKRTTYTITMSETEASELREDIAAVLPKSPDILFGLEDLCEALDLAECDWAGARVVSPELDELVETPPSFNGGGDE